MHHRHPTVNAARPMVLRASARVFAGQFAQVAGTAPAHQHHQCPGEGPGGM